MSVIVRDAARADLSHAFAYIGEDSLPAADRFLRAAADTFVRLAEMPGMGHTYAQRAAGSDAFRVWPVKGFENWLIFYRPTAGGIEVIRILHGARDLDRLIDLDEA